ncbi:Hypothetical predicted protein [Octopus vulgaris]|uniref:Uncharacterized protein n=1 Tax=Octopus vulgaris TaxID=6645 RepID=A0AA36B6Y6_OCTVU|nr:Hypothetical predicted protein [Octopus vulgaris]
MPELLLLGIQSKTTTPPPGYAGLTSAFNGKKMLSCATSFVNKFDSDLPVFFTRSFTADEARVYRKYQGEFKLMMTKSVQTKISLKSYANIFTSEKSINICESSVKSVAEEEVVKNT